MALGCSAARKAPPPPYLLARWKLRRLRPPPPLPLQSPPRSARRPARRCRLAHRPEPAGRLPGRWQGSARPRPAGFRCARRLRPWGGHCQPGSVIGSVARKNTAGGGITSQRRTACRGKTGRANVQALAQRPTLRISSLLQYRGTWHANATNATAAACSDALAASSTTPAPRRSCRRRAAMNHMASGNWHAAEGSRNYRDARKQYQSVLQSTGQPPVRCATRSLAWRAPASPPHARTTPAPAAARRGARAGGLGAHSKLRNRHAAPLRCCPAPCRAAPCHAMACHEMLTPAPPPAPSMPGSPPPSPTPTCRRSWSRLCSSS